MSTAIIASSYYVPETRLTHAELATRYGEEMARKVAESAGIWERRIARPDECASDLAVRAAEDLLTHHHVDRSTIDLIIFATQTPDYLLPTTACMIQDRLKLPTSCAAFDINLGCSQYVYSLAVAHSMIEAGLANRALVMTGDTVSRILHPQDRSVVPLFGDAGTATLLERCAPGRGFLRFKLGTDGKGAPFLIWPASGLRKPPSAETARETIDKNGNTRRADDMAMDGAAIFVFTLKTVPKLIEDLLAAEELTVADVDLFIFHQASELIVESSAKKLKIPREKLHYKVHDVGNSGGSTVGIALTDAWLKGRIRPGMTIVLSAFGVGLSWAGAVLRWPEGSLGPVCTVDFSGSPETPLNQRNVG
jgi:3-oxoacyl-[acyl-carrier-protein] synthase III